MGTEVKNSGAIPPLPHTSLQWDAELIKHRDNFTLPLISLIFAEEYPLSSSSLDHAFSSAL
jgi:hypothetical protein